MSGGSSTAGSPGSGTAAGSGGTSARPASTSATSCSEATATTSTSSTSAASRARATGTTIRDRPCARVPCATASAPRIGRSSPVSESSPANTQPSTCSRSTCPLAARTAIATGRSKPGPILRR